MSSKATFFLKKLSEVKEFSQNFFDKYPDVKALIGKEDWLFFYNHTSMNCLILLLNIFLVAF